MGSNDKKKSLKAVLEFAVEQINAQHFRGARPPSISATTESLHFDVRRCFAIEASLSVDFKFDRAGNKMVPKVQVNFPACNKDVVTATAFLGLVQEIVLFAASLQAQLDEFEIEVPK